MNTLYPNLRIKYCIPEIKCSNILYTQKPWPTLTRKTPGKTQHSPAVTPGKHAVHFTFSSTWQTRFNSAFCNSFYHRYQQRVNRPLTAVFYLGPNITCQEFPQLYFDYLTSNNFAKKPVSVNITTEIDFSVISVQQILNMTNKTSVLEVCRNCRCFLPNSRHAKCMQRLLLLPPRGREAKDFR